LGTSATYALKGIGIYTTFRRNKNNELKKQRTPSPAGEGWGDDCMDAEGRATHGAVAEENKINCLYPLIPAFSLEGEGADTCVETYALKGEGAKSLYACSNSSLC
jgi:hypothetical protein